MIDITQSEKNILLIEKELENDEYEDLPKCWLCDDNDQEEIEECSECGQYTCTTCGEWKNGSFICVNCIDDMVDNETE